VENVAHSIKKNTGVSPVPEHSQEDKISPMKAPLVDKDASSDRAVEK